MFLVLVINETSATTIDWAMSELLRNPKVMKKAEAEIDETIINEMKFLKLVIKENLRLRANFEYTPFGAGRRICPGISYGMANVELPLAMLLYHFDWELPNGMKGNDLNMTESFDVTIKRKDDLYAIPIPYHPSSTPQDLEKEA
ncbi:hypothetical protein ACOSQ3_030743 [Xanthoceras sorbifolium]